MSAEAQITAVKRVALCAAADVAPDLPLQVVLAGTTYAVYNVDDRFYVTQDQCTHGPGSLAEGFMVGCEIECPFHQGRFDVRTGLPTAAPCIEPLKTWAVEVIDGQICIDPSEHRVSPPG